MIKRKSFLKPIGLYLTLFLLGLPSSLIPCTVAVVSGKATPHGRPLLWKNRDTSIVDNRIAYFKGEKYAFVALINAHHEPVENVWAGINTQGLAIINAASSDLATGEEGMKDNGHLMKMVLGECADISEFEKFLQKTNGKRQVGSNYGVIDARGNACFFETSSSRYSKFDANDFRVAPDGYIVRTNFAYTAPHKYRGGGYIRWERASRLFKNAAVENRLTVRFILQEAARDLVNEKLHSYPLTNPPLDSPFPLYINTNDTINRNSTVSVALFQGTPYSSKTYLSTMWIILGQPVCNVALPTWPHAENVPELLSGEGEAPLNQLAQKIRDYLYPDQRGHMRQYLHLHRLLNYGEKGLLPPLLSIENKILTRTQKKLKQWEEKKPSVEEMFSFEKKIANWAYQSLQETFAGLL